MMSNKIYWIPVVLLVVSLFTACKESEAPGKYDNWQELNEVYLDSLENVYKTQGAGLSEKDSLYCFQDPFAQHANVYYKKLNPEDKDKFGRRPLYTEEVSVFYQGYLIDGDRFDGNFMDDNPGDFDSPNTFSINGPTLRSGFCWALQYMHVGERWMVYMPWQSAYGTTGDGAIPGYSVLIFDLLVEEIVE